MSTNHTDHCRENCLGFKNNHGGCCTIDNRDYIIGPIHDNHEFLDRVRKKFPGIKIEWRDLFLDFEEGSKLFPDRSMYQNPAAYPALRPEINHKRLPCIFYNSILKCCSVYDIRPDTCKKFYCPYLVSLNEYGVREA